jgi:ADP-ribose pyrophosphatase YjhB (NUDIX family)
MIKVNPTQYGRTKDWPFHISSGGAVYKEIEGSRRYAVLYRKPGSHDKNSRQGYENNESWNLPKGTLHHNETLEECTLREIKEESGLEAHILVYLGGFQAAWTSHNGMDIDKVTHYFLCRWTDGDGSKMDSEHDELQWYSAEEAIQKLSQLPKREDEIIRRAENFINNA